jgi:D-sedoheptulose 7-phosphate isomerase
MTDKFPSQKYDTAQGYFDAYRAQIARAWSSVDAAAVARGAALISACLERDGIVYACGNGGSAAIANHLLCDFHKGIQTGTDRKPRVVSLSCHLELLTAIANDISYEDVFSYQLRTMARPNDLLITISSSGNSENIVRAIRWAKDHGIPTIALVGFSGGRSATMADVTVHVAAENYGIVEDVHQSMMHLFAQYLRQSWMNPADIEASKF